jgi:hypothetical protein
MITGMTTGTRLEPVFSCKMRTTTSGLKVMGRKVTFLGMSDQRNRVCFGIRDAPRGGHVRSAGGRPWTGITQSQA